MSGDRQNKVWEGNLVDHRIFEQWPVRKECRNSLNNKKEQSPKFGDEKHSMIKNGFLRLHKIGDNCKTIRNYLKFLTGNLEC